MLDSEAFRAGDIYLEYPYEDVKFRWEHETERVYRRFYGKREVEVPHDSNLFNEAIRFGEQITREEYWE
jgi:hypothetical protein